MRSIINLFAFWLGLLVILAAAVMSGGCYVPPSAEKLVSVITLEDGTRCAVFQGYHVGGITCDWGSSKR